MTKTQINFINEIKPIIKNAALKNGYNENVVPAIVAQACLESNYGKSSLSSKYFNYFGLKCGSSWTGKSVNLLTKEEYTKGSITTIKDNFRVYSDMKSGVQGYFDFIKASRYAKLKTAKTAKQYLEYIKAAGYATSSTYVELCMKVVNSLPADTKTETKTKTEKTYYSKDKIYTTKVTLNVRSSASASARIIKTLNTGTKLNCLGSKVVDGATWFKHNAGWSCGITKSGKYYIK